MYLVETYFLVLFNSNWFFFIFFCQTEEKIFLQKNKNAKYIFNSQAVDCQTFYKNCNFYTKIIMIKSFDFPITYGAFTMMVFLNRLISYILCFLASIIYFICVHYT